MIHHLCTLMLIIIALTMRSVSTDSTSLQTDAYYEKFKYEDADPSELMNARFVNYYANCLLDDGKCSVDGRRLKAIIPEAVSTHCAKCSPNQKNFIQRVMKIFQEQYPQYYCRLTTRYDSNTQYRHKNEVTNDDDSDCV